MSDIIIKSVVIMSGTKCVSGSCLGLFVSWLGPGHQRKVSAVSSSRLGININTTFFSEPRETSDRERGAFLVQVCGEREDGWHQINKRGEIFKEPLNNWLNAFYEYTSFHTPCHWVFHQFKFLHKPLIYGHLFKWPRIFVRLAKVHFVSSIWDDPERCQQRNWKYK